MKFHEMSCLECMFGYILYIYIYIGMYVLYMCFYIVSTLYIFFFWTYLGWPERSGLFCFTA